VSRQAHKEWCNFHSTIGFNTLRPVSSGYCVILWHLVQCCQYAKFNVLLNVNDKHISQFLSFPRRVNKVFTETSDNNNSTETSRSYTSISNSEADTLERKGAWLQFIRGLIQTLSDFTNSSDKT